MGVPGIALVDAVGVQGSALGVAAVATGVEEPTVAVPAWWLAAAEVLLGERPPAETVEGEGSTCRPCRARKAASSQSWGGRWLERRF